MTSKYAMNKTEAANYFKRSPNTIKKAIETHNIKPCGKDNRGTEVYECKDLAPYLVDIKKRSRKQSNIISDDDRSEIEEYLETSGSMKELKEWEAAQALRQKRMADQKKLVQSDEVITTWAGTFSIFKKKLRQITTEVERISDTWTPQQSERLDKKLATIANEVTRKAQEFANELHDRSGGDA